MAAFVQTGDGMASKFDTTRAPAPTRLGGAALMGGLLLGAMSLGAAAQSSTVTADDYARAERMLGHNTSPLVDHALSAITWADDGHVVYVDSDADGARFMRLDVATGKAVVAFDHARLGDALAKATGKPVDAKKLNRTVSGFELQADGRLDVDARGTHYLCDLGEQPACTAKPSPKAKDGDGPGVLSPDKRSEAFIRDWNLWLRDLASGKETQLTTDGAEDYGYATDNAGWVHSDRAILVWSPDSKKIATFQQDQRKTGEMTLVSTNVGHPKVETWKYPLVGDKDITMIERVVIDVPANKVVRLKKIGRASCRDRVYRSAVEVSGK